MTAKVRQDKKEWERTKFNRSEYTSSQIWGTVRKVLGWGGGGPPSQLFNEGQLITSPKVLASTMNLFFLNKIKKLKESIPMSVNDPLAILKEAMKGRRQFLQFKTGVILIEGCLNHLLVWYYNIQSFQGVWRQHLFNQGFE